MGQQRMHSVNRPRELGTTPQDVMRILGRHYGKAMIVFAVTVFLFCLGVSVWPRTYRSEAKLLVRLGPETVGLDPTITVGQTVSVQESREGEINSIVTQSENL